MGTVPPTELPLGVGPVGLMPANEHHTQAEKQCLLREVLDISSTGAASGGRAPPATLTLTQFRRARLLKCCKVVGIFASS